MLDEKDLQVLRMLLKEQEERINDRMDRMFQAQDEKIDKLFQAQDTKIDELFQEQRRSIMHDVKVLMDAEFKPRFDLLAEDVQIIREKMLSEERMEEAEADIQVLKTSVRMINEEIRELKRA